MPFCWLALTDLGLQVFDSGLQFMFSEFTAFLIGNGIKTCTTAPGI